MTLEEINEVSNTETKAINRIKNRGFLQILLSLVGSIIATLTPFLVQIMNGIDKADLDWSGSIWAGIIALFFMFISFFGFQLQMQKAELRKYKLIEKLNETAEALNEKRQEQGLEPLVVGYNTLFVLNLLPASAFPTNPKTAADNV